VSVASERVRVTAALVLVMAAVALASHGHHDAMQVRAAGLAPSAPVITAPNADADAERPTARALREGRPLDLNRASETDLMLLPGIGPSLARRIVESRAEAGPFPSVEAVDRVRGIGPRMVERLRPLLYVGAPQ
jgi:competence protein ComEA